MFYERIRAAWTRFSEELLARGEDVALVTHGGVIHVIRALVEGRMYSNQEKQKPVAYTQVVALVYENGVWKERGNSLEKTQNDPV